MSFLSLVLTPKSCCFGVLVSFRILVVASPIAADENLLVPVDVALLHHYPQPQKKYGWFQCIPAVLNREVHCIIYFLLNSTIIILLAMNVISFEIRLIGTLIIHNFLSDCYFYFSAFILDNQEQE